MNGRIDTRGRTIAVVLSGGNIDDALLREILSLTTAQPTRRAARVSRWPN